MRLHARYFCEARPNSNSKSVNVGPHAGIPVAPSTREGQRQVRAEQDMRMNSHYLIRAPHRPDRFR